jgi:hypothetical protein
VSSSLGAPVNMDVLIEEWFRRVRVNQHIHYMCANLFSRLHLMLGIPTMVFATAVGTALFVSIEKEATGRIKIIVGLVSLLAAVLSSLQTFLGLSERAEKHRATSARYGAVRRRLELLKTLPRTDQRETSIALAEIKTEIDHIADASPEVPKHVQLRARKDVAARPLLQAGTEPRTGSHGAT